MRWLILAATLLVPGTQHLSPADVFLGYVRLHPQSEQISFASADLMRNNR